MIKIEIIIGKEMEIEVLEIMVKFIIMIIKNLSKLWLLLDLI